MYLENVSCPKCKQHDFVSFDDSSGAECTNCKTFLPDAKLFELCETCNHYIKGGCKLNWVCGLNCKDYSCNKEVKNT